MTFNLDTKVYFDFDEIIYLRTQKIIEFCDRLWKFFE